MLAASLLLSALPVTPLLSSAAPLAWSEGTDAGVVDQPTGAANGEQPDAGRPRDGASSVRQRGREAPVDLLQVAADENDAPEAVGADPGDGPPPARKNQKSASADQAARDARNANIRMWPMPAESYTFTQPFGCVPQIAHFYQPGAGCPADRPVVHTGLDLAAPEGTPFYAAASGWVTESGYDREVGVANTRIIIQHEGRNDGYATEYLHWVASFVDVGDHVEAGQLIGEVGSVGYSTGPHLHFSLIDLDSGEHADPTRWLPEEPGTEGYRGITPRRAAMRLPAGTTAGVPEHTDPNPPDAPTRDDLPESADAGKNNKRNKDRGKHKKGKQREERQNKDGKNREKDTRKVSGKDGATSEDGSAASDDKQADRDRSRTRKRERNRDGAAKSHNASGEDSSGNSRKERRKKDTGNDTSTGKDDKRSSRKEKDPVEQTDTRDKGNNKNGNGGGGNKSKQNRQQDDTQQVAEETPAPVEEAPVDGQEQEDENGPGRDGKDGDNGADNPDGDAGNGGNGQDNADGEAGNGGNGQAGGDGDAGQSGGPGERGGDGGDGTARHAA
ncbi:MAG: peptidoglycan DD-metalloendopeptidase family protein [Chloroflexota bacterium]|nr:peptidoglycan DD-metalloendopeptidase family protein [Chloroflexota bacterium]